MATISDLNMYDTINTMTMRLLSYNNDRRGFIVFYNFNKINKETLWLLHVGMDWAAAYEKEIYISSNWWTYIKLKYFYKIKKIKRVNSLKRDSAICSICVPDFVKEVTKMYGKNRSYVENIYDEYYNRRRK